VSLWYEVEGDGPWLTLLHAFSQDSRVWDAQRAALAPHFRLILPDLRGHGRSDAPASGYGPVEYMDDLLAVLDHVGARSTHVWGTHTGASVALLLAVEHPERVASLTLEGAVIPGVSMSSVEEGHGRARQIARDAGVEQANADWFDNARFFDGMHQHPERRRLAAQREIVLGFSGQPWLADTPPQPVPDVLRRLATLRQPAILINGGDDLPDFLATAEMLERTLPNARRYVIPGAGAFPAWEEPEAVTPLVQHFLEDID
jgi:pimeloyl-ACP methyl ester carboxylesterase